MRTNFDFAPFRRSTVGFDRLFDLLENAAKLEPVENYPPFDLERLGENEYRITMAVAGFRPEEIDINVKEGVLSVAGRKSDDKDGERRYLHRGIGSRAFERRFQLADFVQVRGADLKDGMLYIDLVREIPEAMRPRRIEIGGNVRRLDGQQGEQQRIEQVDDGRNAA
jgi:molecular chaperone IbpA